MVAGLSGGSNADSLSNRLPSFNKMSKDGTTASAVRIKNNGQLPCSQSTNWPLDDAKKVRPSVPSDASNAY